MKPYVCSTDVAAKKVGVSRQTLHGWIEAGHIPAPKSVDTGHRSTLLWAAADVEKARKFKGSLKPGPQKRPRTKK